MCIFTDMWNKWSYYYNYSYYNLVLIVSIAGFQISDVTKIQTSKLLILLIFYFNEV